MTEPRLADLELEDRLDAAHDLFERAEVLGWGDGLPLLPATDARVEAALACVSLPSDHVVARLPPFSLPTTVEKIAICAVMAGCRPEYLPVLIAAVQAVADPRFELLSINTSTNPASPLIIVNGPVRERIGLNSGPGVMGPGCRANATLGRALSLVMINAAGRVTGAASKTTHAQPARFGFCIAEYEESSPWEPLHVEKGFAPNDSCVTLMAPTGTMDVLDYMTSSAEGLLKLTASSLTAIASTNVHPFFGLGPMLLVLCPDHARRLGDAGMTKQAVKEYLADATSQIPLSSWPEEVHELLIESGRVVDGCTPLVARPDQFELVVAGGHTGLHTTFMPTFGDSWPISRPVDDITR